MLMKFKTWIGVVHDTDRDLAHQFVSDSGKSCINRKALKIGSYGYPILVDNGSHDLYAEIQSYKDSTDLSTILSSFDLTSASGLQFDDIEGQINDFTNAPKTPGELLNTINEGKLLFNSLPVSVKGAFGNSLYNFVQSFGSDSFVSKLQQAYGIEESIKNNTQSINNANSFSTGNNNVSLASQPDSNSNNSVNTVSSDGSMK